MKTIKSKNMVWHKKACLDYLQLRLLTVAEREEAMGFPRLPDGTLWTSKARSEKIARAQLGESFEVRSIKWRLQPIVADLQERCRTESRPLRVLSICDGIAGCLAALLGIGGWDHGIEYISVEKDIDCRRVVRDVVDHHPTVDLVQLPNCPDAAPGYTCCGQERSAAAAGGGGEEEPDVKGAIIALIISKAGAGEALRAELGAIKTVKKLTKRAQEVGVDEKPLKAVIGGCYCGDLLSLIPGEQCGIESDEGGAHLRSFLNAKWGDDGTIDLIMSGYPCKGHSSANRQQGGRRGRVGHDSEQSGDTWWALEFMLRTLLRRL